MNTPSLVEVLIVTLAFGIVGTYMLACRHLLDSSLDETPEPRQAGPSARQPRA